LDVNQPFARSSEPVNAHDGGEVRSEVLTNGCPWHRRNARLANIGRPTKKFLGPYGHELFVRLFKAGQQFRRDGRTLLSRQAMRLDEAGRRVRAP
jgi:hypothetical protein